jgi:hypothetical protein
MQYPHVSPTSSEETDFHAGNAVSVFLLTPSSM